MRPQTSASAVSSSLRVPSADCASSACTSSGERTIFQLMVWSGGTTTRCAGSPSCNRPIRFGSGPPLRSRNARTAVCPRRADKSGSVTVTRWRDAVCSASTTLMRTGTNSVETNEYTADASVAISNDTPSAAMFFGVNSGFTGLSPGNRRRRTPLRCFFRSEGRLPESACRTGVRRGRDTTARSRPQFRSRPRQHSADPLGVS